MTAFDKPPPSLEDAKRLSKYFIVMPVPKPGIKIGKKVYNGKAACIKDWPKITEEEMITQMPIWFNGKNENNIAVVLKNNGLVIDIDGEKCENIILTILVPKLSPKLQEAFRKTARTRTGGGGEHILFGINSEEFPEGIASKKYLVLGKHEEIKLNANGNYAVERGIHESGKEYKASVDIEHLVYLSKDQVEELLSALSNLKPEAQAQAQEQTQKQNKQSKRKQQQEEETKVFSLDDSKIESIVKELAPFYKTGSRDEIVFSLGGCLHKWQIERESAVKTINLLATDTSDEERSDRIQTINNTYTKKRDSSDVSGRNRFIETLAVVTNVQTAIDIVTKITQIVIQARNEHGGGNDNGDGGGNGKGRKQQQQQQPDEDEELAATKLTKQDIDFMFKTMMKESKYDELSVKQTVYGLNSAFTKLPIPHVSTSKESGAGKSYIVNHIAGFYPDKYITRLAGVSNKALFHLDGPMIIVKDEETGEFELLDNVIILLETKIEECEEEIKIQLQLKRDKKPYDKSLIKQKKKEIKEIEKEITNAEKSAQKLIDFDNKILIVQDTPSPEFFNMLMTILSQDTERDQEYAFADKSTDGKHVLTSKNRIRGMPVIMTTQVIDDTDNSRFEEKIRRFIHISPNTSGEKIKEANRLTAFKYGYLKSEYDRLVVSRVDLARTKQIVKIVVAKLKQQKKYLGPKESGVKIPFAITIGESLPAEDGEVWQMTVGERTMKYLSMVTKLNMDCRPRLVHKETRAFYPISSFEDLRETMLLMERGGSKVRPYLQQWFNDVFVKCMAKQNGQVKEYQNDVGIVYKKESFVGVTTEDLSKDTEEDPNDIRKKFLDPLVNLGLIQKFVSVKDNRSNLYCLPEFVSNAKKQDKTKIIVKDPNLYPGRNLIVDSLRTVVNYDADDPFKNKKNPEYEILDENGQEISSEELADRYYNNPEDYFTSDF